MREPIYRLPLLRRAYRLDPRATLRELILSFAALLLAGAVLAFWPGGTP